MLDPRGAARSLLGARCVGCRAPNGMLCAECAANLARPVEEAPIAGIAMVLAPWRYEGAARRLILDLKLRGLTGAGSPIIDAMVDEVRRAGPSATTITWVPGKRPDMRRRGFDHAELLARGVAARLGLAALPLLHRIGRPLDQSGLGAVERHANLAGAFRAHGCSGSILLVDDLVTSGATAIACGRSLVAGGATRVELLTGCRV